MLTVRLGPLAGLVIALAATGPSFAGDTVLLGGVGSLHRETAAAKTLAIQGSSPAADDTVPVCCWWKPWRYGYAYAPVCPPVVYATPAYYPPVQAVPTAPPPPAPSAYYQPLPFAAEAIAVAPPPRPTIVVGYQGRFFSGSIALRPGSRSVVTTSPSLPLPDRMPAPRPTDSFRYDGGPANPVPMPVPDPTSPTDPVPATVPALHAVMAKGSRSKMGYSAYGERPATRQAVEPNPLLVQRP